MISGNVKLRNLMYTPGKHTHTVCVCETKRVKQRKGFGYGSPSCLIRQSTDKKTAWSKVTLAYIVCALFGAFLHFYGTSFPPFHFILDVFVLQEAAMCSFSSISSTLRQDQPLQLNCPILWPQCQVKEPLQFLSNTRAVHSWCLWNYRIMKIMPIGVWRLKSKRGCTDKANRDTRLICSSVCSMYKNTTIWGLISSPSSLCTSVSLSFLPHAASPHSCFEVYSKLQPHYSAACSSRVRLHLLLSVFMISIWTTHASLGLTYTPHHSLPLSLHRCPFILPMLFNLSKLSFSATSCNLWSILYPLYNIHI